MMEDKGSQEHDLEVFASEEADGPDSESSDRKVASDNNRSNRELTLGVIESVDPLGQIKVSFDGVLEAVSAMATFNVSQKDVGRQVVLMFVSADQSQPVAIGLLRTQLDRILELQQQSSSVDEHESEPTSDGQIQQAVVDGKTVKIEGKEEIVLKCGDSSITLNKNGKIVIRGKYLLNRSSGVNRIMGGSVQLN